MATGNLAYQVWRNATDVPKHGTVVVAKASNVAPEVACLYRRICEETKSYWLDNENNLVPIEGATSRRSRSVWTDANGRLVLVSVWREANHREEFIFRSGVANCLTDVTMV